MTGDRRDRLQLTQHHTGERYTIAAIALVVLAIAIAFSKRKTSGLDAGSDTAVDAATSAPSSGDASSTLRAAIDRWIYDLGREEHDLRDRLLEVKQRL